ncbi:MAG TPA: translocation/assembly module TamB, partial [Longimicrobiaceae bacterium]|nr:translocation/assembly module TamB [Longimicrobiaceae bacterium]
EMPRLRIADPDSTDVVIDVARLSTLAELFNEPGTADVRDLAGHFRIGHDSIHVAEGRLVLPASRIAIAGVYVLGPGVVQARARAPELAFADLRWAYPPLPEQGGGRIGDVAFSMRPGARTSITAVGIDLHEGAATVAGRLGLTLGDTLELRDTDLRFADVDTRLIARFAPRLELPREGTLGGRVRLAGEPHALRGEADVAFTERGGATSHVRASGGLGTGGGEVRLRGVRLAFEPLRLDLVRAFVPALPIAGTLAGRATVDGTYPGVLSVDGDLTLRDPRSGTSHVLADGGIRAGQGDLAFRELMLTFAPLQVALARELMPELPIGGILTGRATLDGPPAGRLAVRGDLVHTEAGARSHVVGRATLVQATTPRFDADVRLLPLDLATAGRFVPAAGLHGDATGRVRAAGTLRNLRVDAALAFAGAGTLDATGRLDLASRQKAYDFTARLARFDAGGVTTRAPPTRLTGRVAAEGRGVDPATLQARVVADLTGPALDAVRLDSVRLAADVAGGVATIERATVRLASAELEARGTFGLVAGREGEIDYRLVVDSLSDFAGLLPPDTTAVAPRPAPQAAARERVRADSVRLARETEVERVATGRAPPPPPHFEALPPLRRDSLAGRLVAEGTLRGSVRRFDAAGTLSADHLVALGSSAQALRLRYTATDVATPRMRLALDAAADSLLAAGFALDSATAKVRYLGNFAGPERGGSADVHVYQDSARDYRVRADFALALDRSELRLEETALRFDTVHWTSTEPGTIRWGGGALEVDHLALTSDHGGRIFVDGRRPATGAGALDVVLDSVQIGDVTALLQGEPRATGLVSLNAHLAGTRAAPLLHGTASVTGASYEGRALPDASARFDYANTTLAADAVLTRGANTLLTADARLPIDLALAGAPPDRLLRTRPLEVDVRADSVPLDALPSFTDAVDEVRGRAVGRLSVRGTYDVPHFAGDVAVDLASFRLVPVGVTFHDIAGALVLAGDSARVDSLVAESGGPIRVTGAIDVGTLTEPGFALRLDARDALLLDNQRGRLFADAELDITGPYDRVAISGDVDLKRGVIYIPESQGKVVDLSSPEVSEVVDTAAIEAREVLPAPNPLLANLRVDVAVAIEPDTWVRSADANIEIYTPAEVGPLHVTMDRRANTLSLLGTINTDRGEYEALSRRFAITSGGATFQGGPELNPLLHLIAQYDVSIPGREGIAMQIHVGGTLRQPTLSLESNAQPPISQSDLLSYLAFGTPTGAVLGQSGSALSGASGGGNLVGNVGRLAQRQLTTVALGALVDEFERSATRAVGLDVFRITPAPLAADLSLGGFQTVLAGTEIEAGKYLSPRWFVAGQVRPTAVPPGARVEYRTPHGFRWIVSYEPRFLPREPTFEPGSDVRATGALGALVRWEWRY